MSNYRNILASMEAHIKSLRIALGLISALALIFAYGWWSAPRSLVIHNPPDLRSGSTRAWWEVDPANVYSFTFYIFQQLNRWAHNGTSDYLDNIKALAPYLTPSCSDYLMRDYQKRLAFNELSNRTRSVFEIPGRGYSSQRVEIISQDSWRVILDLATDEHFFNNPVKRTLVRYPLKTVRYDVDPERNPWGLALDCYFATPLVIKGEHELLQEGGSDETP